MNFGVPLISSSFFFFNFSIFGHLGLVQVIDNSVFAFTQPPSLGRHIATTVVIVSLAAVVALFSDCIALVVQINVIMSGKAIRPFLFF